MLAVLRPIPPRQRVLRTSVCAAFRQIRTSEAGSQGRGTSGYEETVTTRRASDGRAVSVGDQDHELRVCAEGMGAVQWAAAPHQPESSAVFAARDHLRRGWPSE